MAEKKVTVLVDFQAQANQAKAAMTQLKQEARGVADAMAASGRQGNVASTVGVQAPVPAKQQEGQPQQATAIDMDSLVRNQAYKTLSFGLGRQIQETGSSRQEMQLYDALGAGLTSEQLAEIKQLQDTLTKKQHKVKLEADVDGLETSLKRQLETLNMTPQEVQLFDLKNLGATEEQLERIRQKQEEIRQAQVTPISPEMAKKRAQESMGREIVGNANAAMIDMERRKMDPAYRERAEEMDLRRREEHENRTRERALRRTNRIGAALGIAGATAGGLGMLTNNMGGGDSTFGRTLGGVGGVVGGAGGGLAAGGQVGQLIGSQFSEKGGLLGAAIGSWAGLALGAVGGIFSAITSGAERAKKVAQEWQQMMEEMNAKLKRDAADTFAKESRLDRIRTGGRIGAADAELFSPGTSMRLARTPRGDGSARMSVLTDRLAELERTSFKRPYMGTGAGVDFDAELELLRRARSEGGIEGITRAEGSGATGLTTSAGIGESIMESLAARSPGVRATEETRDEVREVKARLSEILAAMTSGVETLRTFPGPSAGP